MSTFTRYNEPDFRLEFIGIGAAKSGTTWISDNLRHHPDVFVPEKKELVYFNQDLRLLPGTKNPDNKKPLSWYHDFFRESDDAKTNGEISVEYLLDKGAPANIKQYNPDVKIIAIFRKHPDQLFSLYQYMTSRGVFHYKSFEAAIEDRSDLFKNYFFADYMERYFALFPPEQIGIFFFDDIVQNPEKLFGEICEFIGVQKFLPDSLGQKSNKTKEARFPIVNHSLQKIRHFITQHKLEGVLPLLRYTGILPLASYIRDRANVRDRKSKPVLADATREMLQKLYANDVLKLEKISGRNLDHWK